MKLFLLLLLFISQAIGGSEAQAIKPEDLFAPYEFSYAKISPDGKYLAVLAAKPDAKYSHKLLLVDLDSGNVKTLVDVPDQNVSWISWANNNKLLYGMKVSRYAPRNIGFNLGIYATDLVDLNTVRIPKMYGTPSAANLLDTVPSDPNHVLMDLPDHRKSMFPIIYRVNINDGESKQINLNDANIIKWIVDNDGQPRAGRSLERKRNDLLGKIVYRARGSKEWKSIKATGLHDFEIVSFDSDNQHLFLSSSAGSDRQKLFRFDIETRKYSDPLASDSVYDVSGFLMQDRQGHPVFLRYPTEKYKKLFFSQEWADRQATLDDALPNRENRIIGWSDDEKRLLVSSWSDRHPGEYYLYDEAEGKLRFLVSKAAWIDPGNMAEMQPIVFQSRDGLDIHGYLTLPQNAIGTSVPLLVFANGGMGSRNVWGYDRGAQFFASRGYAVMQINTRGTAGYGEDFAAKGHRQLTGRVLDDLADAVHWGIEKGVVTPGKVCIYGKDFGGYMVLMALARVPDLFHCGVEYGAPVDLSILFKVAKWADKIIGGFEVTKAMRLFVGDPRKERKLLDRMSPINRVADIKASLLVIEHVPKTDKKTKPNDFSKDLREFVKKLTGQGNHVEHEEVPYVVDGLSSAEEKVDFYTKVAAFLDRQIGSESAVLETEHD